MILVRYASLQLFLSARFFKMAGKQQQEKVVRAMRGELDQRL
jgi:hypothetical protein